MQQKSIDEEEEEQLGSYALPVEWKMTGTLCKQFGSILEVKHSLTPWLLKELNIHLPHTEAG